LLVILIKHARVNVHTRIVGEEFLLFSSAFVRRRVVGGAQLWAQSLVKLLEMLRQCFVDVLLLLGVLFLGEFFGFAFDFRCRLAIGLGIKRHQPLLGR